MGSKSAVKERRPKAATAVQTECRHHWIIESPRGALSAGRCKLCGAERQFRNSANDYIWDDDDSSSSFGSGLSSRARPAKVADDEEMSASGSSPEPALVV